MDFSHYFGKLVLEFQAAENDRSERRLKKQLLATVDLEVNKQHKNIIRSYDAMMTC